MAIAYFADYGCEYSTKGDMIVIRIPCGSDHIELVMTRGTARQIVETGRRELAEIERVERAAILNFPTRGTKPSRKRG
jgi:hypothetical protein